MSLVAHSLSRRASSSLRLRSDSRDLITAFALGIYAQTLNDNGLSNDRQVLLDLYESTNGDNWTDNTNWLGQPGTECSWKGITCDTGPVIEIDLQNNNLSGRIPGSLNRASELLIFDVSSNHLTGSIPSLSELSELRYFSSRGNPELRGPKPSLVGLDKLETFMDR